VFSVTFATSILIHGLCCSIDHKNTSLGFVFDIDGFVIGRDVPRLSSNQERALEVVV
jgi:hypothetical protein